MTTTNAKQTHMSPLKESTNTLAVDNVPKLELTAKSPPKLALPKSPVRLHSSPTRAPLKDDPMSKPPGRISPMKGARAKMTADQVFSSMPAIRVGGPRPHSIDRVNKPNAITFESLMPLASSNFKNFTPSRMITSRRRAGVQSEQLPTRVGRGISRDQRKDPANNLMDSFNQKSILKRRLSPPEEEDVEGEMDLTTTLNTKKNAESAKSVMNFLQAETTQPRKKRAVTFDKAVDTGDISVVSEDNEVKEMLKTVLANQETARRDRELILQNQKLILKRLDALESKSSQ